MKVSNSSPQQERYISSPLGQSKATMDLMVICYIINSAVTIIQAFWFDGPYRI